MENKLLIAKNISKSFSGVQALKNVDITINKGEVHCLVGENGSGKSTLIKIVAGVVTPDEGEIVINGNFYKKLGAIDSIKEGIQVIYQDLSLFPLLSVAENISLNQLVEEGRKVINWDEIRKLAEKELKKINIKLNLEEKVENLSMANKQIVAIVRALTQDAKLIIMDEPTSALTKTEVDSLFSIILDLKQRGISTLFISHKLSEVLEISDKVTVLRDGNKVGEFEEKELDNEKLIFHMTGKTINESTFKYDKEKFKEKPILEVKELTKADHFRNVSFELKAGEIFGLTGLLGSGRTELALSLFGLNPPESGDIIVDGKKKKIKSPKDAIKCGIGYLPEDRYRQGLFLHQSIGDNIIVTIIKKVLTLFGLISESKKIKQIEKWSSELKIKAASLFDPVESLSGGNQQRVVLAKWLATNPKIFILDGPTVAIDIASKAEIHKMIRDLAEQGIGIILISDEISEVLHNCNRIGLMEKGEIKEIINPLKYSENQIYNKINKKN